MIVKGMSRCKQASRCKLDASGCEEHEQVKVGIKGMNIPSEGTGRYKWAQRAWAGKSKCKLVQIITVLV